MIIDVHIDSLHTGHKTGLYYDGEEFDHKPSKSQKWLWKCWELFWDDIEKLKKKHKAKLHVSVLGEAGDINYAQRKSGEFWAHGYLEASNNAIKILEPVAQMADWMHFFKGTEAHVGGSKNTIDELIASNFDTDGKFKVTIPTDTGRAAHAHAVYELAGVTFDVAHHGKNRSKWAEENMLTALRNEVILERAKNGEKIPDVISRGHTHWSGATDPHRKPMAVQVPSFQLPYGFIYRIDPVVRTPVVGAAVFLCHKGKVEYFPKLYTLERTKTWKK